jgi:hypothetical protein
VERRLQSVAAAEKFHYPPDEITVKFIAVRHAQDARAKLG